MKDVANGLGGTSSSGDPGGSKTPEFPNDPAPRKKIRGPLGIPAIPSRAATPPPPSLPAELEPLRPVSDPNFQEAAAIVGYELPPVERMIGAVQDAADIANRLEATIRTVLSTNLATADAIQGKFSSQVLGGIQAAIEQAQAACGEVHSCVIAQALGAIATVDQWLLTLGLPPEIEATINAELGSIFGVEPPSPGNPVFMPPSGPSGAGDELFAAPQPMPLPPQPGGGGTPCPPGFHHDPNPFGPCVPNAGPPLPPGPGPGPPQPGLPPAPGITYGQVPCNGTVYTTASGWVYANGGAGPAGAKYISDRPPPGATAIVPWWGVPSCSPPGVYASVDGLNFGCVDLTNCTGGPTPPGPPAPPPGPPAPPPAPPASCPCVTCKCDPCTCPKPQTYCGAGTHWDDASQKCVPDKPKPYTCPPGSYWDDTQQQCVKKQDHQYCVYCRASDSSTYLVEQGEEPEEPDDYILTCYESLADVPPKDDWPECGLLPEPPDVTTTAVFPAGGVWCSLSLCDAIAGFASSIPSTTGIFQDIITAVMSPQSPFFSETRFDEAPALVRPLLQLLWSGVVSLAQFGGSFIQGATLNSGCASPVYFGSLVLSIFGGLLERWVSSAFDEIDISNQYYRHLLCPQLTLTSEQATAAYLAGAIDKSTLQCLVGANNNCWEPWQAFLEANRTKLGVGELNQLRLRGEINAKEYNDGLRKLGYTDDTDPDSIFKLTQQIPFVSDILRMMVRDVADPAIVGQFGMDDEFTAKYQGQLKEWGRQQGVPDIYAQYIWRAHWSIPSPTQLYEMFRRLRNTPSPTPGQTWEQVVETALKQQDILPFWIKPLMSIAYHPLTATDLVRAYSVGSITEQDVTDGYTQLGYDDANAAALTKFRRRERIEAARTLPQSRLYLDDGISKTAYAGYLLSRNYPPSDIDQIVALLDQRKVAKTTVTCAGSIRKRYMKGELDVGQVVTSLIGIGLEGAEAGNLANRWQCEFSSRDPHLGIRLLIPLYKRHVIDVGEFLRRAGNLGVLPDLAGRIIQQMDAELGDQAAAAAQKKLRAAQKLALQSAKAAARAAKQAAAAAEKAAKQQSQAAKASAALRKTIDATILKAVKAGAQEADATDEINAAIANVELTYGASPAEAAAIAALAVETTSPWNANTFNQNVQLAVHEHIIAAGVT